MDFELSAEQKLVHNMVREFAEKEILPKTAEIDKEHRYPSEIIKRCAELNLMGMLVPPEYGGAGLDAISYAITIEELSRASASVGVIVSVNNSLSCFPINNFGTEGQKKKYLTPLAKGEKLGAYALTEPSAGSDPASMKSTVTKENGYYNLNGSKTFITNGAEADLFITYARLGEQEKRHKNVHAFILERDTPGLKIGRPLEKMGIHGSSTVELFFDGCKIPEENLLGKPNEGFKVALATLDEGRIGIAAQSLGIAQSAFDAALKYSKYRVQGGKLISEYQAIQWKLADMATEIDAARLLVYRAADLKERRQKFTKEASMAKLFASELAVRAALEAIQIHGGYGFMAEYPVERILRDSKITTLYEGTSEIQRLVIARELLRADAS
jgi:alkylation response protein AidB-like acyl-CoA dehydrogenase